MSLPLEDFINKCHSNVILNKNVEVEGAIDYLAKRGVKSNTVSLHKIGYCCNKDIIPPEIRHFGCKDREKDYGYKISGTLIVPVYGEFSEIVGFATRKPSFEEGNSWWNIARPFKKGDHLFLLDKMRKDIFTNNKIYLVEGYMDAIILHQEGLKGVVAVMGIKMSPRKMGLIARYCNNICICMDTDKNMAGQKAQSKMILEFRQFDFCESISIIENLPIGEDPDVFVCKNGLSEFLKLERKLGDSEIDEICKEVLKSEKKKHG